MYTDTMIRLPRSLSDQDLVTAVARLVGCERETTVSLIAHLMEFDARRLYLGAGCPSLFVYCTDVLRLSGHEAYHRIEAARLARRFPVLLRMLAEGALNLTTARLLGPHLSDENHEALLAAASGKSKREVELLLARRFPQPDRPTLIRKVPVSRGMSTAGSGVTPGESAMVVPPTTPSVGPVDGSIGTLAGESVVEPSTRALEPVGSSLDATESIASPAPQAPAPDKRREVARPLADDRYEIRFTVSGATRDKLRLATDLLRHAVPDGDAGEVIDRALTALLEDLARKKFAATPRPRPVRDAATGTRHVPAHVKRAVWLRDGARCAFVGGGRHRCHERGFLEFHHVRPHGVGGEATVENIELRCHAHNAYEAERFYGRRFVPPRREAGVQSPMAPTKPKGGVELVPDRVDEHRAGPRVRAGDRNGY